jgi:hypothetical protein
MIRALALLSAAGLLFAAVPCRAHRPSDSYLLLSRVPGALAFTGYWDLALRDLDHVLHLDDGDGSLRWGELRAREAEIAQHAQSTLQLSTEHTYCTVNFGALRVMRHSDGAYARLPLAVRCPSASELRLGYSFLAGIDPSHRALLRIEGAGEPLVLKPSAAPITVYRAERKPTAGALAGYLRQGALHIVEGLDHVLFLLVLLLPAVLRRQAGGWQPAAEIGPVLRDVLKVITAFTLAHSITLSLAALGTVRWPRA